MSFQISVSELWTTVHLQADLNRSVTQSLVFAIKDQLTGSTRAICLDMKERHLMDSESISLLAALGKELAAKKCILGFMRCTPSLQTFIRDSTAGSLPSVVDEEALAAIGSKRMARTVDVAFVNPFIEGAMETLKVQCSLPCKPGKPFLRGTAYTEVSVDIAGILGLNSPAFTGSVALCFPEKIFLKIMGNMIGEECPTVTKDLEDGASELLNIIFGQAKTKLNSQGYSLDKALPVVVRGDALALARTSATPVVALPFETEFGYFFIEIGKSVSA